MRSVSTRAPWVRRFATPSSGRSRSHSGSSAHPCLPGADNGVRTVGHLQFAEDVGDIVAHRVWAKHKAARNLVVAVAKCDEVEDFSFAFGEVGENLRGKDWPGRGKEL